MRPLLLVCLFSFLALFSCASPAIEAAVAISKTFDLDGGKHVVLYETSPKDIPIKSFGISLEFGHATAVVEFADGSVVNRALDKYSSFTTSGKVIKFTIQAHERSKGVFEVSN